MIPPTTENIGDFPPKDADFQRQGDDLGLLQAGTAELPWGMGLHRHLGLGGEELDAFGVRWMRWLEMAAEKERASLECY